jgi:hydrogenase maturation protease
VIDLLVIGYGNELRGDDGAGPRVARAVAGWVRPGVRALAVHQLIPELAAELAAAERVVFVDAAVGAGTVCWRHVHADAGPAPLGHTCDPGWLLALAQALDARAPTAWLVTIPARCLGCGDELSAQAERGVAVVLRQLAALAGDGDVVHGATGHGDD